MTTKDILNAFRQKFPVKPSLEDADDMVIYSRSEWGLMRADIQDFEDWLLTTLTEFERETKERIKLCAKEQSCSMCMESLSQLEKEKRT